ncbi:hypothetical protein [Uliginosibacterium flavum]|uniref:Uncharacterized protein n=2 Tax=Uliginosibacterium flavum TaxID=1396831 RepID=A0ABV2TLG7_9RHOO
MQSTSKAQKIAGLASMNVAIRVTGEAAHALSEWPNNFHCLLRRIMAERALLGSGNSLALCFGRFYQTLYNAFPEPEFNFLRQSFEAYVSDHWEGQLAERNRRLSKRMRVQHDWVPTKNAARALAVRASMVREFVERGLLVGRLQKTAKGRVMGAISKSSLENLLSDKLHWVTLKTVRTKYGISRRTGHALIEEEVLKPISGPSVDGRQVWLFDDRDLEKLDLSQIGKSCLRKLSTGKVSSHA